LNVIYYLNSKNASIEGFFENLLFHIKLTIFIEFCVLKVFHSLWDNHNSEESEFRRRFINQHSFAMCQFKIARKIKISSKKRKER
jgi:hypothetical protein